MKKLLPYLLIGIVAAAGMYMSFDGLYSNENNVSKQVVENNQKIDNQYETILIYPKKNKLPEFKLNDHKGNFFTNNDFKGYWNFIFIGYTNCPDVCPNTLNQMTQLYRLIDEATLSKIQFVFLSVDPERDTPEHMGKYLDYFDANLLGITGETTQIDTLVKSLGGVYSLNKEEGEFYTVDHSARIFLVGREAERFGILESSALKAKDKTQLVKDITNLVK